MIPYQQVRPVPSDSWSFTSYCSYNISLIMRIWIHFVMVIKSCRSFQSSSYIYTQLQVAGAVGVPEMAGQILEPALSQELRMNVSPCTYWLFQFLIMCGKFVDDCIQACKWSQRPGSPNCDKSLAIAQNPHCLLQALKVC